LLINVLTDMEDHLRHL